MKDPKQIVKDIQYTLEQIEEQIFLLTEDLEDGQGTIITRTKLAVYTEIRDALEDALNREDEE